MSNTYKFADLLFKRPYIGFLAEKIVESQCVSCQNYFARYQNCDLKKKQDTTKPDISMGTSLAFLTCL